MPVKRLFGRTETHTYRQGDEFFALFEQTGFQIGGLEALHIFLGSEHKIKGFCTLDDLLQFSFGEDMMIGERHELRMRIEGLHVLQEILGLRYTAEYERRTLLLYGRIVDACEMEMLIGGQMESVIDHPHVNRPDGVGTLGDDDGIRFECS